MKKKLTNSLLQGAAESFSKSESRHDEPTLYGVTDGKAVGTYLEHKFKKYLHERFEFEEGSSARGIDLPELGIDIKATSSKQPQSSCPFKSAKQNIFGLGYSLLIFVYKKTDNDKHRTAKLEILHSIYVDSEHTADYQTTSGIRHIIENDGNKDDLLAFFGERALPVDSISADKLADEVLSSPPEMGYLTISNALQWRLQYRRVIEKAGSINGIIKVF